MKLSAQSGAQKISQNVTAVTFARLPQRLDWQWVEPERSGGPSGGQSMMDFAIQTAAIMAPVVSDPNRVEALRNRVALYRGYLRVGVRGDCAIQYMRQIADDLDEIEAVRVRRERPWIRSSVGVSLGDVSN